MMIDIWNKFVAMLPYLFGTGGVFAALIFWRQRSALETQKVEAGSVDIEAKKIAIEAERLELRDKELSLTEKYSEELADLHEQVIEIRRTLRIVVEALAHEKSTNIKLIKELRDLQVILEQKEQVIIELTQIAKIHGSD